MLSSRRRTGHRRLRQPAQDPVHRVGWRIGVRGRLAEAIAARCRDLGRIAPDIVLAGRPDGRQCRSVQVPARFLA